MSRLVIVSNRVAPAKSNGSAGGLGVAVNAALRNQGGVWFGWSGKVTEAAPGEPEISTIDGVTYATVDLDPDAYGDYYKGYANRTLWPLFHYRLDLTHFDRQFYEGYQKVNVLFARQLSPLLRSGDRVWVHDYHLIPLGEELRRIGCTAPLGFFLHIPFPVPEVLATLPNHRRLIRSLLAYDLVGFQTTTDLRAFTDYVVQEIDGNISSENTVSAYGRTVQVGVFPIGLDTEDFAALADSAQARRQVEAMKKSLHDRYLIIGVDRLDYTKGLPERLQAFQRLLEDYPDNRNRVSLLQIATPSRSDVPEYRRIRHELEATAGRINGRFAEVDWVPIRYVNKLYSRRSLAGLYRASRVGLVTPFRDGMNLVAKEYTAAQDEEDPGVLVLSRFAGAARQLSTALIVNPHDDREVAENLQRGLQMSLQERRERWSEMMEGLRREDVHAWRDSFLDTLGAVRLAA